jgi:hypothetical protein
VNGLSIAIIGPYYCYSRRDVDVERLECIVNYLNGISLTYALNEVRREMEGRNDDESCKSDCYDSLAYPVLRKKRLRPFDGAASMAILVLG